jgi:hypothetical protein
LSCVAQGLLLEMQRVEEEEKERREKDKKIEGEKE